MKNGLPISYTQQWATVYLLVAAPHPLSAQEVLNLLSPWLTGKLKTPQLPAVKSVRVEVVDDLSIGPSTVSRIFGQQQTGSLANNMLTGVKWNLRSPSNSALTDEFAGSLRSGFRSTGKQDIERLGYKILQMSIHPRGRWPSTVKDYGIPALPDLPQPAVPVPPKPLQPVHIVPATPVKTSMINWIFGALAMILVAYVTASQKPQVQVSRFACSKRR